MLICNSLKNPNLLFFILKKALRENCPYSEIFWSVFSRIWTENGEILSISPYSVRMLEIAVQKNAEKGHFSNSKTLSNKLKLPAKTLI